MLGGEGEEGIPLKVVCMLNVLGCEEIHSLALVASSLKVEGSHLLVANILEEDHDHCNWEVWVADSPYVVAHRKA